MLQDATVVVPVDVTQVKEPSALWEREGVCHCVSGLIGSIVPQHADSYL